MSNEILSAEELGKKLLRSIREMKAGKAARTSRVEPNAVAESRGKTGPLIPELQDAIPDAFKKRIKRRGVVNAWDDPAFAAACRDTGRKNFVMAGVTTDVFMVAPAISAVKEGFIVKVVCDACGSINQIAEEMSWRRMEAGCVHLTSTNAIVAELVGNRASPAGAVAFPLLT